MIEKNKFYLLIFFFFIFTTYSLKEPKKIFSIIFPIKEIVIEGARATNLTKLQVDLNFLINTSLFFLKEKEISIIINEYDFIKNIQLKKKYPNILKVLISEKIPVATEISKKKKYYLTKNGKKINYVDLKFFENLPVIFGNHKNFSFFFNNLEKSNFKINNIKAFYYFEAGRWDIVLRDERVIKLPESNYNKILIDVNLLLYDFNFSKYKTFDYRIKEQLILQ